jgi:hypothetical protein
LPALSVFSLTIAIESVTNPFWVNSRPKRQSLCRFFLL